MTDQARPRAPFRKIMRSFLRSAGTVVVLTAIYFVLPLDHIPLPAAAAILVIGLTALIALVTFQVHTVILSAFPALRAVESLATSVPLFLLLFASSYVVMESNSAKSFSQALTHTDALYFTVTVFSTVGFGDITPTTQAARLVVTGQMIADLVIIGIGIKVITGAVQRRRQQM